MFAAGPLHPHKRTCLTRPVMSQKGQFQTHAVPQDGHAISRSQPFGLFHPAEGRLDGEAALFGCAITICRHEAIY